MQVTERPIVNSRRRWTASSWLLVGVLALLAITHPSPASAADVDPPIEDLARFPQALVAVETATGPVQFRVWLADTPARQQQGLMFVRDLPADQGMLFVNDPPRPASFWMKNTYIPLDLLFIDRRGRILHIFENATPLSLKPLGIDQPVRAVLEIRGGESARRGIRRGAKVHHSAFSGAPTFSGAPMD